MVHTRIICVYAEMFEKNYTTQSSLVSKVVFKALSFLKKLIKLKLAHSLEYL